MILPLDICRECCDRIVPLPQFMYDEITWIFKIWQHFRYDEPLVYVYGGHFLLLRRIYRSWIRIILNIQSNTCRESALVSLEWITLDYYVLLHDLLRLSKCIHGLPGNTPRDTSMGVIWYDNCVYLFTISVEFLKYLNDKLEQDLFFIKIFNDDIQLERIYTWILVNVGTNTKDQKSPREIMWTGPVSVERWKCERYY